MISGLALIISGLQYFLKLDLAFVESVGFLKSNCLLLDIGFTKAPGCI